MLETRAADDKRRRDVATQQAEIIQPIFGPDGRGVLGNIPMPTVPGRRGNLPRDLKQTRPRNPGRRCVHRDEADIPAGSFTADLLKPQAAQAQIEYSREDAATLPLDVGCARKSDR